MAFQSFRWNEKVLHRMEAINLKKNRRVKARKKKIKKKNKKKNKKKKNLYYKIIRIILWKSVENELTSILYILKL